MKRLNVTQTFLPPVEEYKSYIDKIWASRQLTNGGALVCELEDELRSRLGVQYLQYVANGTLALQLALRTLEGDEGEIITTPFSYVATTSAILWERFTPVYVDIEPNTLCIDVAKIEAAITDKTKAIMAVHVFGNPCDVEAIEEIAKKHRLKVIYDAAHAFGVKYKGKSIFEYGDISTCSFHATKLYHTIEGGAVISKDKNTDSSIDLMKRFGHTGDEHYRLGINAKSSEMNAAMGLLNLKYVDKNIQKRKHSFELYKTLLKNAKNAQFQTIASETEYNFAYFPVVFSTSEVMNRVCGKLNEANIFPRRYFYPSLNKLPYANETRDCPISEDISSRIVCLPFYAGIEDADIRIICDIICSREVYT